MIIAILQARISSSRLPGKVLKLLLDKPMLLHQIERIHKCKMIDNLIVATSVNNSDDPIFQMCEENEIEAFRGSLNNVLERYYECAKNYSPNFIVRLTGDCPLVDSEIIDETIEFCISGDYDYVGTDSNFPDGISTEVMTMEALEKAYFNATLPSEKEHMTQYIINRPSKFKIGKFKFLKDMSHIRLTVDEPEDFILVERIYKHLYHYNPSFSLEDVLDLIKNNPELEMINNKFTRDEGLIKSLLADKNI